MNRLLTVLFLLLFGMCYGVHGAKKINVLILSGKNNHNWEKTTPYLVNMFSQTGQFKTDVTEKPDTLKACDLAAYDVVLSNWTSFPNTTYRWPEETEKSLINFIREGGGFVTFHASSTAFYEWPEFKQISTGAWINGTKHGKPCAAHVNIQNLKHPITKGMADFCIYDELWENAEQNPGFTVLATANNQFTIKDRLQNQPVVMVKTIGKGRIFHTTLGHDVRMMRNTGFQTLLLRGTEWAASGKVKQKLPQELRLITNRKYHWQESDTTFALLSGENIVWQYNFRERHQKPFFNPVFVGRNNITCVAPDDHPWHAGQWFSWKYINKINYWEFINRREYRSEGTTEIKDIKLFAKKDFSAVIKLEIVYHPADGEDVLAETRTINVSGPQKNGTVSMDYQLVFKALAEKVELNRTPIEGERNGKIWGGYGGLSLRFNQSFMDSYFIAETDKKELHASTGNWLFMGFTGIDGKKVGSQIIIHPNSQRHEAAWYVTNQNDLPFYYFSPAYLFRKSFVLSKDEELVLNYRINHIEGATCKAELEQKYQEYKNEKNQ